MKYERFCDIQKKLEEYPFYQQFAKKQESLSRKCFFLWRLFRNSKLKKTRKKLKDNLATYREELGLEWDEINEVYFILAEDAFRIIRDTGYPISDNPKLIEFLISHPADLRGMLSVAGARQLDLFAALSLMGDLINETTFPAILQSMKTTKSIDILYILKRTKKAGISLDIIQFISLIEDLFRKYGKRCFLADTFPFEQHKKASAAELKAALITYLEKYALTSSKDFFSHLSKGEKHHLPELDADLTENEMAAILDGELPLAYYHACTEETFAAILGSGHLFPLGILLFESMKRHLSDEFKYPKAVVSKIDFGNTIAFPVRTFKVRTIKFYVDAIFGDNKTLQRREVENRLDSLKTRMRHQSLSDFKKGKLEIVLNFKDLKDMVDVPGRDEWFVFFATPKPFKAKEDFARICRIYGAMVFELRPSAYRIMNWALTAPGGREYLIDSPQKGKVTHDIITNVKVDLKKHVNKVYARNRFVAKKALHEHGYDFPVHSLNDYDKVYQQEIQAIKQALEGIKISKAA